MTAYAIKAYVNETQSATNEDSELAQTIFKAMAMVAVIGIAIFGNSLVIYSVYAYEKLRVTANAFIMSLAFADLLVSITAMPFNASQQIAGKWLFGQIACNIFNANDVLFSTASILHLCCISMDRYIAITDPFHYQSKMNNKRAFIMLAIAWSASGLISHVPIHLGLYTTNNITSSFDGTCDFKVNKVYSIISSSISFWIPCFIMVIIYARIYIEARKQELEIRRLTIVPEPLSIQESDSTSQSMKMINNNDKYVAEKKKLRREHKAAKTLGIIMGAFILCWFPFFAWYISDNLIDSFSAPASLVNCLFWIGYFNSALNPMIYAFFNTEFRNAFKKTLQCGRRKSSTNHGSFSGLGYEDTKPRDSWIQKNNKKWTETNDYCESNSL